MQSVEIKGTVSEVIAPDASGKTQSFIINTDGSHPKTVAVKCWLDKLQPPAKGSRVTAHVNIASREYNGKWYTDVTAWKIEGAAVSANAANYAPTTEGSDLPF